MSTVVQSSPTSDAQHSPGVALLMGLIFIGTFVLFTFIPLLGAVIGIIGIFLLWRIMASKEVVSTKPVVGQRLSRLAFISTIIGTISIGVSLGTGWMLPAVGFIGVLLGLMGLRYIRRQPEKMHGRAFGYVGIVLGMLQVFVFTAFYQASPGWAVVHAP